MKNISIIQTGILAVMLAGGLVSCGGNDKQKDMEAREEAKVGKVYDPEKQGIDQETRDNQFPSSRNDNSEGVTGQETGARTDTTTVTEKP